MHLSLNNTMIVATCMRAMQGGDMHSPLRSRAARPEMCFKSIFGAKPKRRKCSLGTSILSKDRLKISLLVVMDLREPQG